MPVAPAAPVIPRLAALALLALTATAVPAQERGAAALGPALEGLGVSVRALVIAAHPDDEDTPLITWLAKGRHVETAYLSLTRGDGGQNLIGNELGEELGAIRTQELLAARRIDGGRQFFTRAYDFGFSKSAEETLTQWVKDSILRDVVTVVRVFRPHVIVSVFSGTPADGHGHHQAAGILAREAYDLAADTVRFPRAATAGHAAWTVAKFYRGASFRNQEKATIRINVGEYDPILGRSYAEIAAESRSQHKSQAFGVLQLKGPRFDQLLREATRVNAAQAATTERSLFDGIDTTWGRFRALVRTPGGRAALDSLPRVLAEARRTVDLFHPERSVPLLARADSLRREIGCGAGVCGERSRDAVALAAIDADLAASLAILAGRLAEALATAAGVALEATAPREVWALGERIPMQLAFYNRGRLPVRLEKVGVVPGHERQMIATRNAARQVAPDSVVRDSLHVALAQRSEPWWLGTPRRGAMFGIAGSERPEGERDGSAWGVAVVTIGGVTIPVSTPVTYRHADPVRGEINRPIAAAPALTLLLDNTVMYAPANAPLERTVRVQVTSHGSEPRDAEIRLALPAGLVADSAVRRVAFAAAPRQEGASGFGAAFGVTGTAAPAAVRTVTFNVRGRLAPGRHELHAVATSEGTRYASGFVAVDYEHVHVQRLYRPSSIGIEAVDVRVPRGTTVGYIAGVGDNVAPMLEQLGVAVTPIDPAELPRADLARFSAIVVGPRAYEANASLVANNARLLDFARTGGTLVVQYGQYEMTRPGIMPFPITLSRPAERVTVEDAPVRIVDSASVVIAGPNRITASDFAGWVQDRSLYMPSTFDPSYAAPLEMHDPGERPNRGGILVAGYGEGTYVYTSLAFFRQLPSGVPGAARLLVNLLAARAPAVRQ